MSAMLLLLAVTSASHSHAHAPVVELKDATDAQPIVFTWPLDISVAVYGFFENSDDVDVIRFSLEKDMAKKGQPLYVHTLVPACSAYRDLLPAVAITGPVQAALPQTDPLPALPFEPGPGDGIVLLQNTQQGITWYEPYSKKNYFWQQSLSLKLTATGEYRIRIWSPDRETGDYVLAVGTRERWGLREIARATRHMPGLLGNREIHDESCRQELGQQAPSPNPLPVDAHSR